MTSKNTIPFVSLPVSCSKHRGIDVYYYYIIGDGTPACLSNRQMLSGYITSIPMYKQTGVWTLTLDTLINGQCIMILC